MSSSPEPATDGKSQPLASIHDRRIREAVRLANFPVRLGTSSDGVHNLPIKPSHFFLIALIFVVACCVNSRQAWGQNTASDSSPAVEPATAKAVGNMSVSQADLARTARELEELRRAQAQAKAKAEPVPEIDRLKAQLELQQKQIDVLLRMTQMLAGQVKNQPAIEAAVEQLEEQAVANEAQNLKKANKPRPGNCSNAQDRLNEHCLMRILRNEPQITSGHATREVIQCPVSEQRITTNDLRLGRSRVQHLQWAEQHVPRSNPRASPLPAPQ